MLSVVRTSAERRRPQRPEFADTTVWGVASFVSRLSIGCAKVAATSLRRCTRGGVIVINSPLNLNDCHRRSSSTPTKQPQRHTTTRSLVTEAIQAWLTLEPLRETDAPTRISDLQRTLRHLVRKCNIPIPAPGEEATATEWRRWAAGSDEIPGHLRH